MKLRGKAFTLIELLAVVAILAILAAISFPLISGMIDAGKRAECMGNLRSIYSYLQAYAQENNGEMPKGIPQGKTYRNPTLLLSSLEPYVTDRNVFYCPAHFRDVARKIPNGYTTSRWNAGDFSYFYYHREGSAASPRRNLDRNMALLMSDPFDGNTTAPISKTHRKTFNIMRLNGSVELVKDGENIQPWMLYKD